MLVKFPIEADKDLKFHNKSGNKAITKKIFELIESIKETPFDGIGKPEQLKLQLTGYWPRRINSEHQMVYKVIDQTILIISLKGHY